MPIRPKKALLDKVADAISRARWAEKDLQDLDQRALKMQGSSKTWAKNADRFNRRAAELEARKNYNNWLSNKLRADAQENVNNANRAWNNDMDQMLQDQGVYIDLDRAAVTGRTPNSSNEEARRIGRLSGVDDVENKDAFEIADEMADYGLYPTEGNDVSRFNPSNSSSIDDIVPDIPYEYLPKKSGEDGWGRAISALARFRADNKKQIYGNDEAKFRGAQARAEEAMRAYQQGGKRYR